MSEPEFKPAVTESGEPYRQPEALIAAGFVQTNAQLRKLVAREQNAEDMEGLVSNMQSFESTESLEDNPTCPTCQTTLQTVLYGMPTAEAADSGKYLIMGCTIQDDSPSEKWFCPECEIFVA